MTVPAFTLNARFADQRSSRIGSGSRTVPFGIATITVIPSWGTNEPPGENRASDPSCSATAHGSVEPRLPWKHATRWMAPGARTVTSARTMDASHSCPIAFQYSSS